MRARRVRERGDVMQNGYATRPNKLHFYGAAAAVSRECFLIISVVRPSAHFFPTFHRLRHQGSYSRTARKLHLW